MRFHHAGSRQQPFVVERDVRLDDGGDVPPGEAEVLLDVKHAVGGRAGRPGERPHVGIALTKGVPDPALRKLEGLELGRRDLGGDPGLPLCRGQDLQDLAAHSILFGRCCAWDIAVPARADGARGYVVVCVIAAAGEGPEQQAEE